MVVGVLSEVVLMACGGFEGEAFEVGKAVLVVVVQDCCPNLLAVVFFDA